jgi:hypothetical protein
MIKGGMIWDEGMTKRRQSSAARSSGRQHGDRDKANARERKHAEAERKKTFDRALDLGLEESFPGSDPVSVAQPPPNADDKDGS